MLKQFIRLAGLSLAIGLLVSALDQVRSDQVSEVAQLTPAVDTALQVEKFDATSPTAIVTEVSSSQVNAEAIANAEIAATRSAVAAEAQLAQLNDVRLEISLGYREVSVYQGDIKVKTYPIGIGRAGWETPTGMFEVKQMRENPTWISPFTGERIPGGDPRNPMGQHWIGFWTDGNLWVGFHGTPDASTVGTAASHGCLHMYAEDLAELYQQVHLGTLVTVVQ
jgi:lipoprotein-anchoring transpeptidase ErfK/SrfK